jgi:YidC/Oxa1 family membrane protein insertase
VINVPFISWAVPPLITNPLVPPLQQMLQWLARSIEAMPWYGQVSVFVGSYAIALILVAIVVKLATYPLSLMQMRSMRSMQQLQPKMAELQERYKGDREKLSQAQMELYKEHGVNPFGGCLPLVITMVLLISLYGAIRGVSSQMQGQPFFWISDISVCEPNPVCKSAPMGIPILVIVMIVSQVLYQKYLTPPSTDPQAKSMNAMMKFMPLVFGYIFLSLPAALVLYYLVFNVVSIAQQVFMNRQLGATTMALSVPVPVAGGAAAADPGAPEESTSNDRGEGRRRRRKKSP